MRRRARTAGALALALALCASACDGSQPAPDGRANLVIVTVDTLRADRLGAYGYEAARTPHLDSLAAQGAVFENALTVIPRTSQAVASLFTGLHPHEHGAVEIGEPPLDGPPTLAEELREAGWATAGISANGVASAQQGLDRGFDTFLGIDALRERHPLREHRMRSGGGRVERAEAVTAEALDWLASQEGPFFLWLLYLEPHFPYEPPPPHAGGRPAQDARYYAEGVRTRPGVRYFDLDGRASQALDELSELYDGEVAFVDEQVGRLLGALRRRDDASRTLVVFVADHGESLGENGYFYEHGDFASHAELHIPLVFHWPGVVSAGLRVGAAASIVDVAPTACGLLDAPCRVAGVDWSDTLRGGKAPPDGRLVFAESGSALLPQNPRRAIGGRRTGRGSGKHPFRFVRSDDFVAVQRDGRVSLFDARRDAALTRDVSRRHPRRTAELSATLEDVDLLAGRWRAVSDGRFKLLRIPTLSGVRYELYDLAADPGEQTDLASRRPEVVERLRGPLDAWTEDVLASPTARASRGSTTPEEVEERLRALGYVE
jgi:arylsulfatase A-like enzyme